MEGPAVFVEHHAPAPPPDEVLDALARTSVSTVGHLTDFGFPTGLTPLFRPLAFVGPAITVKIPHIDHTAVHVAIDSLRPGDVLVIEQSGDDTRSCFGGMGSYAARAMGAVGAVLSGPVNDVHEVTELGFPVYSRGTAAHTTRLLGLEGGINVPVSIGGAVIRPGDIVFADSDGLAVIPPGSAADLAAVLAEKEAVEPEQKRRIDAGARLSDLSGARALFDRAAGGE